MSDKVIEIKDIAAGVVLVKMQDKVNKNTFSIELAEALINTFDMINDQIEYKVVVLTGYENYFASGGTKKGLLEISDGKAQFADVNLYSLALKCPIPVISAMQGHAIGGGFAMGMFADFIILSRESIYTANFMKYGFTPGMGATYVLPQKLGIALAEEMMISAKNYRGEELQKRGVSFPVLPREDVVDYAIELALTVAEKPRVSLITLKDHLVGRMREELPAIIAKESLMHEKTFHQPEVKERINNLFGK